MKKPDFCLFKNKDADQLCTADQHLMDSTIPLLSKSERTSLHKGVLVVPEYFINILVAYSHI